MTDKQITDSLITIEELQQIFNILKAKRQMLLNMYEDKLKPKKELPSPCETCKLLDEDN